MEAGQLQLVALTRDPTIRQSLERVVSQHWHVDIAADPAEFLSFLTHRTAIIVLDEAALDASYVSVVRRARRTAPVVDAIVVGGPKSEDVRASDHADGVDAYHAKPVEEDILVTSLLRRMRLVALKVEGGIVGRSRSLEDLLESVLQIAPTEVPILIEGESGTGKDVIARAIHAASRRADQPFEAVNCGALAEGVLESELFGHEKGAFTGAVNRRAGMFERANGGTIFLDEVGETSPNMQVRLLRVVESGEVMRVGGGSVVKVDVRLVAATNRGLAQAVASGDFRQDLYYRLRGIHLQLPPLRERRDDIPLLVQSFIQDSNRRNKKSVRGIDVAALRALEGYRWPGNIRELRNMIDTLVALATEPRITLPLVEGQLSAHRPAGEETPRLLPVPLNRTREEAEREMIYASILALHRDVREVLALLRAEPDHVIHDGLREVRTGHDSEARAPSLTQMERTAIADALARHGGNRRKAADSLGISERTLYRKIKEYGLV